MGAWNQPPLLMCKCQEWQMPIYYTWSFFDRMSEFINCLFCYVNSQVDWEPATTPTVLGKSLPSSVVVTMLQYYWLSVQQLLCFFL